MATQPSGSRYILEVPLDASEIDDRKPEQRVRVLAQGAVVLLITDGLERDADETLAFEMDRLHRSCRRLIWLNPLLRFEGFEAKARGVRTLLPHVDEFRPIHNLDSIAELCRALSATGLRSDPKAWLKQVA